VGSNPEQEITKQGYIEGDDPFGAKKRTNLKLAVWPTGNDKYITVTYLEAIDGTSPTLIMTRNVDRPRYVVDNLKKTLDNQ